MPSKEYSIPAHSMTRTKGVIGRSRAPFIPARGEARVKPWVNEHENDRGQWPASYLPNLGL